MVLVVVGTQVRVPSTRPAVITATHQNGRRRLPSGAAEIRRERVEDGSSGVAAEEIGWPRRRGTDRPFDAPATGADGLRHGPAAAPARVMILFP
jgi:hypothetical protein